MKSIQTLIVAILLFVINASLHAQEQKSARLALTYIDDNIEGQYIKVKVRYKEDRSYVPAKDLNLNLYKITPQEDEDASGTAEKIDNLKTNDDGELRFYLDPKKISNDEQFYEVKIENNINFKDKSEDIHFQTADIRANISQKDSVNTLNIEFVDAKNTPIPNQYFTIKLKRLFGLMNVGSEDFYKTDEFGKISLAIQEKMYSKSGTLEFIITLDDSNDYGTIVEHINSDLGVIMASKDTFDERTMWGPAAKTPIYMLVIPNILLISIWAIILVLIFNLYKIYKFN